MIIHDRIYGRIQIYSPLIEELILSKPLQRLKKINQAGAAHFVQPLRDVNRLEHSIGVWHLSARYKRPLEEQIAALLHDVSQTSFSHVIDIVMEDETHEFHDRFTRQVILNSEIPMILKRHKIDLAKVLSVKEYPLLDNKLPEVSFDRWDYFMRDGFMFGLLPEGMIVLFLASIKEKNAHLYFEDPRVAALFAILFMNCSRLIWLDPNSHGSFCLLAKVLRLGLKEKVIDQNDFFSTDEAALEKLKRSKNKEVHKLLARLRPGYEFEYATEGAAEFLGPNKPRFVDPLVMTQDGLRRVSELVPNLKYYFTEFVHRYKYLGVKAVSKRKL